MPNTKAAKKALRQAKRAAVKNTAEKNKVKNLLKKALKALEAGKPDEVKALSLKFQKAVDKAVKRGWLKKNAGNRKKSRLAARVKKALKK
ncbi:MAG TPA: 30S ribosomal protein S20 [Patescibacteria group bacterium]|nr:30S ribosomal protein S20 [Patescibacteria group bacterium]